jgi:hypothetical protein
MGSMPYCAPAPISPPSSRRSTRNPVIVQVPDFGSRFFTYQIVDHRTDSFASIGRIMPIFGARTTLPELSDDSYFEPLVRYDLSFAGDPTKKNISNLQLDPMLKISLPDRWFFMLYPSADIRVNYGDPITGQTGRLFLPFDFSVGRSLTKYFTCLRSARPLSRIIQSMISKRPRGSI